MTIAAVGTVDAIWRYPVKSMLGEQLDQAAVDVRGVLGDRLYAVRDADGKLGSGKTTRRFRQMDGLLGYRASYLPDLTPVITLPDGRTVRGDDEHVHWALANTLHQPGVTLAKEGVISHFDEQPMHLVTTASVGWLAGEVPEARIDARRLRPNLVIRTEDVPGRPEDDWVGHELHIGGQLIIKVVARSQRCAMANLAQDGLEHVPSVLRAISEGNDRCLGVHARVLSPGRVRVGDQVTVA